MHPSTEKYVTVFLGYNVLVYITFMCTFMCTYLQLPIAKLQLFEIAMLELYIYDRIPHS